MFKSNVIHVHLADGGTLITNFTESLFDAYDWAIERFNDEYGESHLVLSRQAVSPTTNKQLDNYCSLHCLTGKHPHNIMQFWDIYNRYPGKKPTSPITDTERLDFLVNDPGNISDNGGAGYLYWYRNEKGQPTGHTRLVKGRSYRDAIDAAIAGERGRI